MTKMGSNFRKRLMYGFGAVLTGAILVIIFISPFVKYWIEKNDRKFIGRKVKIGWAYVNPFTGYVRLQNIKIHETQSDSVFLTAESASANFSMLKLFFKTIEISQLTINRPYGIVIQDKKALNFDDLIQRFTPDSTVKTEPAFHVTLLTTKIVEGKFRYIDKLIPINYFVKNVNIESDGKERYIDTLRAKFSFLAGIGTGEMKGNITLNMKSYHYRMALGVENYDLEIIRQYIWELINYGMFTAHLDANINAVGNFLSRDSLGTRGRFVIRDFHLGKTKVDDYVAFKRLKLTVGELNPAHHKYIFDSITLDRPFFKYELFDSLDNVQAMFGKKGKNITDVTIQPGRFNLVIEIARYLKVLARNFFESQYHINWLAVNKADVRFNDYSQIEEFSVAANPLTIHGDSIDKDSKRVKLSLKSDIKPYGNVSVWLSINPKDTGDFDMRYRVQNFPASTFNPYLISYTSYPLDKGTLELNGIWNVRNGNIKSTNHLVIIDPRVTKRKKNKDAHKLPLPLIMAFIRERGNVIDYEIPITGSLKDPHFHWGDVILDLIKNIFVKPPTTPYRSEVKESETEIEKSLTVKWEMKQRLLSPHQGRFVNKISEFLKDHPDASVSVQPIQYAVKEMEYILFFETKKKYFLITHQMKDADFSEADSLEVDKMSVKDHALVRYLGRNLSDTVMFTLQEKCINFVGNELVNKRFEQLVKARAASFQAYFVENGTLSRLKILQSKNSIPYDGFSYFKLTYPGEIPNSLAKAYHKMNELNDEIPRKKYIEQRKKEAVSRGEASPQ